MGKRTSLRYTEEVQENFKAWIQDNLKVVSYSGSSEWVCRCPCCERDKLWVNVDRGYFICYKGCFKGHGDELIAKVEKTTIGHAQEILKPPPSVTAKGLRERMDKLRPLRRGRRKLDTPTTSGLPEEFLPCYDGTKWATPSYLIKPPPEGRGLRREVLRRHAIGFALKGRYRNRVIFPMSDEEGRVTFVARLMGAPRDFAFYGQRAGRMIKPPKYLAAPGTAPLYGYSWIRAHWDAHISELWLVEGVFDAVSMIDAGVLAVASLGKDLTRSQVRSIASLGSDQVIIAYDPDATKAAADAGLFLREHLPETTQVSVVMMSGDMDPDELIRSKGPSALAGLRKSAREIKAGHDALSVRLAGLRRAH